jgi:hypothetical protein
MPTNYTGDDTVAQSPSPAPGPNIAPIIALPVGADGFSAAAFYQEYKTLADFEKWLTSRLAAGASLNFRDDFLGSAISTLLWTTSGTVTVVDDSANGGGGSARLNATGGTPASLTTLPIKIIDGLDAPGKTGQFRFTSRIRTATKSGTLVCGLNSATASEDAYVGFDAGDTHFKYKVGVTTTVTAITPSAVGYDTVDLWRSSGNLTIAINGTIVYGPTTFAGGGSGIKPAAEVSVTGNGDVYVDSVALFVDRTEKVT